MNPIRERTLPGSSSPPGILHLGQKAMARVVRFKAEPAQGTWGREIRVTRPLYFSTLARSLSQTLACNSIKACWISIIFWNCQTTAAQNPTTPQSRTDCQSWLHPAWKAPKITNPQIKEYCHPFMFYLLSCANYWLYAIPANSPLLLALIGRFQSTSPLFREKFWGRKRPQTPNFPGTKKYHPIPDW